MINAHTHLYRGLVPLGMPQPERTPSNFLEILERVWWRLDQALTLDLVECSAEFYVAEALSAGCTGLIDHHESPNAIEGSLDRIAEVCQRLGMPAVLCYGATERNGGREEAKRGLAECRRFITENRRPLIRGAVGIHAPFAVSDETLGEAAELCIELDTVLHLHVAEDASDGMDARKRGYRGIIDRLRACGALESGSIFAHGVNLLSEDVQTLADAGIWLVQTPRSNQDKGVGYPKALSESSLVALGTDGFDADMNAEDEVLRAQATENGDPLSCADMRLDASSSLFSSFWDGALPTAGPLLANETVSQIDLRAQEAADELWKRMALIQ